MAQRLPSSVEEIWKIIVDEVTKCVLDDSPNDGVLANYLGRHVENEYRVSHIEYKKNINQKIIQVYKINPDNQIPLFNFRTTSHRQMGYINENK